VDQVLKTAVKLGSDGRGKDGLAGYMEFLARQHPVQFAALLKLALEMKRNSAQHEA
jgi:hypothetical protein